MARVTEPVEWRRHVGGRAGVRVPLPAGSYSDDTQLRLAVCRAIRGNGTFDAEAFAKIELTVWPSYALGGGRGTKAAAQNLARRDVNWFSNFFTTREQDYLHAGGNGAAMRIQPHVWACPPERKRGYLVDVVRNALITHGHPHGFCGAALHALTIGATLARADVVGLDDLYRCIDRLTDLPEVLAQDRQLTAFWRPAWEDAAGVTIVDASRAVRDEARRDLDRVRPLVDHDNIERYHEILELLGCLEPEYRGSGVKTVLGAALLAWLNRRRSPEKALAQAANVLESDTDTIATMAGAILGLIASDPPPWQVQDRAYITAEAARLALISGGQTTDSFAYPDPARFTPPSNQSDAVGRFGEGWALLGLGAVAADGEEYRMGDAVWQWLRLPFGQTILAKRRRKPKVVVRENVIPGGRRVHRSQVDRENGQDTYDLSGQPTLPLEVSDKRGNETPAHHSSKRDKAPASPAQTFPQRELSRQGGLDWMTDQVIQSNFDDLTLGRMFNRCIDQYGSMEGAVAFASVVAKAKMARQKRGR